MPALRSSAWPAGGPSTVRGEDEATSLAALFAAGALPGTVLQGPGEAEPVDIWRDRPVSRPQPVVASPPAPTPVPDRFVESIVVDKDAGADKDADKDAGADKDADAGLFAPGLEPAGISA